MILCGVATGDLVSSTYVHAVRQRKAVGMYMYCVASFTLDPVHMYRIHSLCIHCKVNVTGVYLHSQYDSVYFVHIICSR